MLSIAIYSDQEDVIKLKSLIQDFLIENKIMAKVAVFNESHEFIVVPDSFDIYIMDMDSKDDVIVLGQQMMDIDKIGKFIYISSYNIDNIYSAAKAQVDYYIEKPVEKDALFKILSKIRKEVKEDSIIIKSPLGERRIRVSSLNYIDIVKRCLCYHLKDGTMFDGQTMRTSFVKAISPLQERPPFLFLPPSLLINVSEIKELRDDHLIFENDDILYFPKKSHDTVREAWYNYNRIL